MAWSKGFLEMWERRVECRPESHTRTPLAVSDDTHVVEPDEADHAATEDDEPRPSRLRRGASQRASVERVKLTVGDKT